MRGLIFAALAGALFGVGLLVSGMTDPARVRGWLDVFGAWDPTLGFVLTGAILPMAAAWRIAARRTRAHTGRPMPAPPAAIIDARLLGGAAIFGLGWGLSGLCPGPAMASIGFGGVPVLIFLAAMVAGMGLFGLIPRR
ncbi:DUF6691 family protein [Paracoccus siganidrum]|uniref:YeeE/YedE family protein n=1 Tax=Paracoccus siganidrum TaxID=1276757 RepID=A0A419A943_9RHOB|nr:DUF6691 family protein [Paracoccus siganidrum]RJL18571.1 hypothetical protein D3P05_07065 [Paracoccus siganidrum]RMC36790.1 hypothetical protein C9E82_09530 [Paracoccus siganidrum]